MNKNLVKFQFSIHQLKEIFNRNHGHLGLSIYKDVHNGLEINMNRYTEIYKNEIELSVLSDIDVLEHIFRQFNLEHPTDYNGKSLSVGDIVELNGKIYFCDSFGWKEINPSFEMPTCTFDEYLINKYGRSYNEIKKLIEENLENLKKDFEEFCFEEKFKPLITNA